MSTAEIIGLVAIALLAIVIFTLAAANSVRAGKRKADRAVGGAGGAYVSSSDGGAHCSSGDGAGGSCDGGSGS